MPTANLISIFPAPEDLLAASPEDLAGVLIEVMPRLMQNGLVHIGAFDSELYSISAGRSYPNGTRFQVSMALAEAMSWLETQGLIVSAPDQMAVGFYRMTRRALTIRTRVDVEAYTKGRILPTELLAPVFAEKVVPLFRRGDHDVAVFQAFKEVEVAVRKAANAKGAGYPDSEVGTSLMRKAFHNDTGPLTDGNLVLAEREAEGHLFAGAIGHAKNPAGHRDFEITAAEAARLIVFASHLFNIVERRR